MYEVGIFSLLIWRLLSRRSSTVHTEYIGGAEMFSMIEIKKSLIFVLQCFSTSWQSLLQCFIQQNSKSCFFFYFLWSQLPAIMFFPLWEVQNGPRCISNPQITRAQSIWKLSDIQTRECLEGSATGPACTLAHWNNAKWCGCEGNVCQNCWVHFNYGEGLCNPPDWLDIIQK